MTVKLRFGFLPIFLAFCFSLSAQSTTEQLYRADKQYDLQAYNLALQSYQFIIKTDPNSAQANMRIADCLFQLNRVPEALTWYGKATSLPDVKSEALLGYGRALMQAGDYLQAKKWFVFYAKQDRNTADQYIKACDYAMANSIKEPLYIVQNEAINTTASDFGPAYYQGNVVFSSARADLKRKNDSNKDAQGWTGATNNQLFIASINPTSGALNKPEFLKSDLANNYNEGPVAFSGDGKRAVFCRNNFVDGTRQLAASNTNLSLYTAEVNKGKWEKVRSFPYNGSDFGTGFPALSADGNTLYFSSNRPNGYGGWDIYTSTWDGKTWAQPTNLGPVINTAGNEMSPSVYGSTLYFSSDYHLGFGGLDVFSSEMQATSYGPVVHLGPGLNSSSDDYGFIYDGASNQGYVVSNRSGGKGNEDIYAVHKKTDDFQVLVTDLNNKALEGAILDFTSCGGKESITNASGMFNFSVAYGKANCTATVKKAGYEAINIKVASSASKVIKVALAPTAVAAPAPAPVVYNTEAQSKQAQPAPSPAAKPAAEGAMMVGQVFNISTDAPLEKTVVVAVLTPSETAYTVKSDANGFYSFPIVAGQAYRISYTKTGFSDVKLVYTADIMKSLKAFPPAKMLDADAVLAQTTRPAAGVTGAPAPEAKVSVGKTVEQTPILASIGAKEEMFDGYSIQIAALPKASEAEQMEAYKALKKFGNVYTAKTPKMLKVRLGIFASEAEAMDILAQVKKDGYKDAFVLSEKDASNTLLMTSPAPVAAAPAPVTHDYASKTVSIVPAKIAKVPVLFAVQVAALSKSSALNLSSYASLSDIGNLYATNEDGATKIRIGVWDDPDEAAKAKSTIQSRGFKDAMIVTEDAVEVGGMAQKELPAPKTVAAPTAKGAPSPVIYNAETKAKPTIVAPVVSPYKVRLAAYTNMKSFDKKSVEGLGGEIETKKAGKSTIVYLSKFKSLEDAINAKNSVRDKGFKEAHVVKEEGGKLVRVRL